MKAFTFLTILLLTAATAIAGATSGYLTRPDDGPDSDARGTVKVKDSPGASLFSIKLKKVDPKSSYDLLIEDSISDPEEDPVWVLFGSTLGRKKWKANTARGDELPLGVDSVSDLAGLRLMVKNEDEETVLVGVVPDPKSKKEKKRKAHLEPEDATPGNGELQIDGSTLRVRLRKCVSGDLDVCIENDDEDMEDVGNVKVGADGAGQWVLCAKKGDPLPFGCAMLGELNGRTIQVRNGEGAVVLEGVIPGEKTNPGNSGNGNGNGPRLRVLVTDAPFPFEDVKSAIVSVKRIEIREVGSPFATLMEWEGGRDLDLVALKNGIVNILYAGDPEPGDYDALRIIVEPKEITILDDGREYTYTEFKVPSGDKTGIKVFVKPVVNVVTDLTTDIVLDFDLANSFIVQGNPKTPAGIKGFHFKPVIRAVNKTVAGSLTFRVMSDNGTPRDTTDDFHLDGAAWMVTDTTVTPNVTVASGASGKNPANARESGYVFHPGVLAGSYKLTVEYRDHDAHVQRSTTYEGNLTDEGTIVLTATAAYLKGAVTTYVQTKDDGKVTFAVAGATVSGALSTDATTTATDTSNSMGDYALTDLAFGTWNVKATMTGYAEATGSSVAWVPGDPSATDLDLELTPSTADITGTVKDDADAVVSGATVKLWFTLAETKYLVAETTTASDGTYEFEAMGTAGYTVDASITVSDVTKTGTASVTHVGPTASTADIVVSAPASE